VKVVMTTHDLGEAARLAGDVVLMHRGLVVESGPVRQLFESPLTEEARRFIAGQLLV
jgi:tungstate transport system ATP-binding protein